MNRYIFALLFLACAQTGVAQTPIATIEGIEGAPGSKPFNRYRTVGPGATYPTTVRRSVGTRVVERLAREKVVVSTPLLASDPRGQLKASVAEIRPRRLPFASTDRKIDLPMPANRPVDSTGYCKVGDTCPPDIGNRKPVQGAYQWTSTLDNSSLPPSPILRTGYEKSGFSYGTDENDPPTPGADDSESLAQRDDSSSIADSEDTDAPEPLDYDLTIFQPVSSVSLSRIRPVLTENNTTPRNKAAEMNATWGESYNYAGGQYVARPDRNPYPFKHNPLYFEDPNLERCGQTSGCLTEITSAIHFVGRIPILPYLMTVRPPASCVRALPDCPTCSEFAIDAYVPNPGTIDLTGVGIQTAATIGLIFLIP